MRLHCNLPLVYPWKSTVKSTTNASTKTLQDADTVRFTLADEGLARAPDGGGGGGEGPVRRVGGRRQLQLGGRGRLRKLRGRGFRKARERGRLRKLLWRGRVGGGGLVRVRRIRVRRPHHLPLQQPAGDQSAREARGTTCRQTRRPTRRALPRQTRTRTHLAVPDLLPGRGECFSFLRWLGA